MATNRHPIARERRGGLTGEQEDALRYGGMATVFEDEEEARAAWERHRQRLMTNHARNGHRPAAWWAFDAPEELGGWDYDTEQSTLYEVGLLSEPEASVLVAWWREQWDCCHAPGFGYCEGPGEWLKGRAAIAAHLRWADIPRSLAETWSKERKSQATGG